MIFGRYLLHPFCHGFTRSSLLKFFLKAIPNNIVDDQFAVRPAGSTTAALSYLFHEATTALEYGNHIRCFLINFSTAFDMVPHHQLLGKLVSYNCPQILINCIANYLTDRTQSVLSVTCSSGCSLPLRITCSIIQGSGFGLAGLIAYIADLRPLNSKNNYIL